jgi:hypothetical protein
MPWDEEAVPGVTDVVGRDAASGAAQGMDRLGPAA